MAGGIRSQFPPLYIAAWVIFSVGILGLCTLSVLHLPSPTFKGLLYIFLGFVAFGLGENINHPKTPWLTLSEDNHPAPTQFYRKRNDCSLGNLIDIGALLLFFIGISALLYPR